MGQTLAEFDIHARDKAIKISFADFMKEYNPLYSKIFKVTDTKEWTESFTTREGMSGVGKLSEYGTAKEQKRVEGFKTSIDAEVFVGVLTWTHEQELKAMDSTTKWGEMIGDDIAQQVMTMNRQIETTAFDLLRNAFSEDTNTVYAPDAKPLISENHIWNTPGAPIWSNEITGNFTEANWAEIKSRGSNFRGSQGGDDFWPQNYDTLIVQENSANHRLIQKTFSIGAGNLYAATVDGLNIYANNKIKLVTVPYFADTPNRWFAQASASERSLYFKFIERPNIQATNTATIGVEKRPIFATFGAGVRKQPIDLIGSRGAA